MKRVLFLCCLLVFLAACSKSDKNMTVAMEVRQQLLQADGCAFQAEIIADYGKEIYHFSVACSADHEGNLAFTVNEPESISGITGQVSSTGGRLTFDSAVLGFPLLADGMLSPVSAPWIFLTSLRSGYLSSCGETEEGLRLTAYDSYEDDALQLDIWLDKDAQPYYSEISWKGRRVLSLKIKNFKIL